MASEEIPAWLGELVSSSGFKSYVQSVVGNLISDGVVCGKGVQPSPAQVEAATYSFLCAMIWAANKAALAAQERSAKIAEGYVPDVASASEEYVLAGVARAIREGKS